MDFKLENVLVSLHSLKTMGSAPLFLRNGELLGHSPILHICIAVGDPVIEMGGLGSSHQEERVEIQLSRWEGWDPINWFNSDTYLCACPKQGLRYPTSYVVVFLCSVSSVKMRGDFFVSSILVELMTITDLGFLFIMNKNVDIKFSVHKRFWNNHDQLHLMLKHLKAKQCKIKLYIISI